MFNTWFGPERHRKRLLNKVDEGHLKAYLSRPFPSLNASILESEFLVLDYETTGLNASTEAILSIGFTVIKQGRVVLHENGHHLVCINKPIPKESVVIHKITDSRARSGQHLHQVFPILLQHLCGRAVVVHYRPIEQGFTQAASQQLYGHKLPMLMFDTLAIERKKRQRQQGLFDPQQLRLYNLRKHYRLPRYGAHNALEDAIATAELFLAQAKFKNRDLAKVTLRDMY